LADESKGIRTRVHVIACGVLGLDLKDVSQRLALDVSLEFLPGGLHNTPHDLRQRLQEAIDRASEANRAEMLAIGYGVCGLGSVGIRARQIPLAIPRVNDCIALFLGADAVYREQFQKYPGTYYISAGWVEEKSPPPCADCGRPGPRLPAGAQLDFDALVQKYGRENAGAIQYFLSSWQRNYQRAAFIDTGVAGRRKYAAIAQLMAREFGWKYEELHGTSELLTKLLLARQSSDEVLVVPPHHVTAFDPLNKTLTAVPMWGSENAGRDGVMHLVFDDLETGDPADRLTASAGRLGLGIDAGGTYTDAVVYDFQSHQVLQKAKALTTKWDFTVGIEQALDQLDRSSLAQVDLVSISTTLATNAIVEGRGQTAGLIIMPPYGLFDPPDILYRPIAILDAKMEIDGKEITPVRPDQVREVVKRLVEQDGVTAFAVTGYASHVNPAHELQVKAIIQQETGHTVTCGHEVSDGVNYRVRATTAALNARIIPCLEALLDDVQRSLRCREIGAPVMVVRSDGSLMNIESARRRPIETILSGPAASVAGASYLSRANNALVVDIGGTTTDTAVIKDGVVRTCAQGARVGDWQTHVHALRMRTIGLGGDSVVAFEQRRLSVGPQRVAPVSWLAAHHPAGAGALPWLERNLDHFERSTRAMDIVMRNGRASPVPLDQDESAILAALAERPMSVHELTARLSRRSWELLDLDRLENHYLIQRCALTPTDLLHATGQLQLWDGRAARRLADLVARLQNIDLEELSRKVMDKVVRMLAIELFKTQLDEEIDSGALEKSPVAMAMIDNLLDGGSANFRVRVQLRHPIIGIGAPAHLFLPQAARLLETEAILPLHADVANAIGAITSPVCIRHHVEISPTESETYYIAGLPDAPAYRSFEEAYQFSLEQLKTIVRERAQAAGTSQTRVEITVRDRIAPASDGSLLFIGRVLEAHLTGRPNLTRFVSPPSSPGGTQSRQVQEAAENS